MSICKTCENSYCNYAKTDAGQAVACSGYVKPKKPQTNADRIRAMSDEELAEYLCNVRSYEAYEPCETCTVSEYCRVGHTGWIDWLQQPAEVE